MAVAAALVVVAVGAATAWAMTRPKGDATSAATTVSVTATTLRQTVTSSGTFEPASQADLSFGASGTVTAVKVGVGDSVAAGQVLAIIDSTDLANAVELAQANVDAASAQLSQSRSSGASSTQIAAAQAQVAAARAKVTSATASLKAATLTAPMAGIVATISISTGSQVGSSGGAAVGGAGSSAASTSSSAQIVVISTRKWLVQASVSSSDLASLKKGLQAEVTPSGSRTKVFGTVSSVGVIASSSSGVATFPVTIAVTGSPTGLYVGGTAGVAIIVKALTDVLTVPTSAIHTENGLTVVHQVKNGATVTTPVTLGLVSGTTTQVTKGLSLGDEVVVSTSSFGAGSGSTGTRTRGTGTFGGTGGLGGGSFGGPAGGGP